MRIVTFVVLAALSSLSSPAFACKQLTKYPQHLWGSTIGWWETYRVVEIVEGRDDGFVVVVKRNFRDKTDVGKLTALRFIANEEAHAVCGITLEAGNTYLIRSTSGTEPLLISRFDWLNVPSTHPKYDGYLQDLEKAEVRRMYIEADAVTRDTQNNRVIVRGNVRIYYDESFVLAEQVIDDRSTNELIAEGGVVLRNADGSMTRSDRFRLTDDYRDMFRRVLIEHGPALRH